MKETKKINKGIIIVIVLLIIVILSLIGYIIYEKIENDKTKQNQNTTSSTTKVINDNNLYKTSIEELLKSKGKTLSENFENVELYFKNISFNLSCTEFNSENKYCDKYNIIINNEINYEASEDAAVAIYIYRDFIILEETYEMVGTINIYDKNNNKKCFEDNIVYNYVKDNQDYKTNLNVENGKLNYASNKDNKILIKDVDISNNFKENIINEFNAEVGIY